LTDYTVAVESSPVHRKCHSSYLVSPQSVKWFS